MGRRLGYWVIGLDNLLISPSLDFLNGRNLQLERKPAIMQDCKQHAWRGRIVGLVRGPGKLVTDEVRGFKSHPLRQLIVRQ